MAKISPKDNFLKIAYGGHPEYVPYFTMMGGDYLGEVADVTINPKIFESTQHIPGGKDMWGVPYASGESTNATMPDTRFTLLEDIENWKNVIKAPKGPKVNEIDWEAMYKSDLAASGIDRTQTAVKTGPGFMPFQILVAMMGFTDGLMALATSPEDVSEMLNTMVDYIEPYFNKYIDVYKPDLWYLLDDTCAKLSPFFSVATYREVFKPIYERLAKPANDRGIPIIFHNCGKIEPFVQEMVDFGVAIIEPTQEVNDILMLKDKFKGKCGFVGGWDWCERIPLSYPEYDEEEMRQGVRDVIDKYAPGGGWSIMCGVDTYIGDTAVDELRRILRDECHWYGRKVYGYKD